MSNSPANMRQVGGSHYASADGIQHWDMIDAYRVGYLEGCASKYLTRWRKKDGVKDLLKASHFLQKLYECRAKMSFDELRQRAPSVPMSVIRQFAEANDLTPSEERILGYILRWESTSTIDLARSEIEVLRAHVVAELDSGEPGRGYVNQDR